MGKRGPRSGRAPGVWALVIVLLAAGTVACRHENAPSGEASEEGAGLSPEESDALVAALGQPAGCDPVDPRHCILPFPSDTFTESSDTESGRKVTLPAAGLPANSAGRRIAPGPYDQNDGFSPNTPILAYFRGVDLAASAAPTEHTLADSVADDSPTVVVDMTSRERLAHWVEVDLQEDRPDERVTILRPASPLPEGHRIAVAFRRLVDRQGREIPVAPAFRALRDTVPLGEMAGAERLEAARPRYEEVFSALSAEGVDRSDLQVAWDFTVASANTLAGRLLAMRTQAFALLGDRSPRVTVTEIVNPPGDLPAEAGRIVRGTVAVPLFLSGQGRPGSPMTFAADGSTPRPTGALMEAPFSCVLTKRQLGLAGGAPEPALPVVYGHGLLGDHTEVERSDLARGAVGANLMYCATDWKGMSTEDVPTALAALGDMNRFPAVADRLQQGILNTLFLARALKHPQGFAAQSAFRACAGSPVAPTGACPPTEAPTIATDEVFYEGNSQGGIMGIAATAVSTEWTKAVLGVPGMNYSLLLNRSVDWSTYEKVFDPAYPDPLEQQLVFALVQMLWDRGEGAGYVQHLTDTPYLLTPAHQVLFAVAFGDHQVTPLAAEMAARATGSRVHTPAWATGRRPGDGPWGIEGIDEYPAGGSALFYWDSGTLPPPEGNINPTQSATYRERCTSGEGGPACADPHEDPRDQEAFWSQRQAFFETGRIIDPCGGQACSAVAEG